MKKIVSFVAAAALAFAPVAAMAAPAAPSPQGPTVESGANGSSISVPGTFKGTVTATDAVAENVPAGTQVFASYEVEGTLEPGETLTLTFFVGTDYANHDVTVYVQHSDGTFEQFSSVVNEDGTFNVTVDRLSTFSVVMGGVHQDEAGTEAGTSATGSATADTNATSPQTSAALIATVAAAAVSTMGAGAAAIALRKNR